MPLALFLLLCAPILSAPAADPGLRTLPLRPSALRPKPVQRDKIAWFAGSYEELLSEAAKSKRIVFLDFYSHGNAYSKKLEKTTYLDAQVVSELRALLCFSIDADTKESKPLRKRFQVQSPPALVFLDPDGTLRDQISGYFAPEPFLKELARIKANQGTFSDLRARIQKSGDDLDSRWELARKLRSTGDLLGYEEQVAEILERDPNRRTMAARRMRLEHLQAAASERYELEPLYQFVTAEKEPALLFEAWWAIWALEVEASRAVNDPERSRQHLLRHFAAARALWPLVPREQHRTVGNNIAWNFYENRTHATPTDLEFALEVARGAVAAAPDAAYVVDTLACCLFALGKRDEALVQVRRCVELDPENPTWRERLALFEQQR
ncbi:MAG: hypothetical protein HOP15_01190 [Planctomycetes bacterium]|nr:hypothetical protein [Planctomycetota bacterium]